MRPHTTLSSQIMPPVQANSTASTAYGNPVTGFLVLLIPATIAMTAVWYKKQHARRRAFTLLQQVAMLEAMWRIESLDR
jgi:hypothetical protein